MFYVYEWYNLKSGEIFYVGKGCGNRYLTSSKRNKLFTDYYNSNDCKSRIVKEFETEQEAFEFEHTYICELKKIGQCKCNLDDGGTGGVNFVWTPEMRAYKSTHNPMKGEMQRIRMSEKNPMKDPEIARRVGRKHAKPVVIKGIEFESLIAAAEYFNRCPEQIQAWCSRGYDSDKEPCRYANEPQKEFVIKITNSKAVIVDDVKYSSVREAAKVFGVWPETIIRAIKNERPFKGHICKYDNQQPSQGNSNPCTLEGSTTNE